LIEQLRAAARRIPAATVQLPRRTSPDHRSTLAATVQKVPKTSWEFAAAGRDGLVSV